MKEKTTEKTLWKKVKFLKMSSYTCFHIDFYVICILKFFDHHISVVVGSFFEFGTVSKWCIRKWVNDVFSFKEYTCYSFILDLYLKIL